MECERPLSFGWANLSKIGSDALGADGLPTWTDGSPNGALRGASRQTENDDAILREARRFRRTTLNFT
ncbi:MAG: hypothetical protein IJE97_04765, partial [Thermoguttaceae bacterium]|nr:hypothetical protein [Thermoguttaceae bacterium]